MHSILRYHRLDSCEDDKKLTNKDTCPSCINSWQRGTLELWVALHASVESDKIEALWQDVIAFHSMISSTWVCVPCNALRPIMIRNDSRLFVSEVLENSRLSILGSLGMKDNTNRAAENVNISKCAAQRVPFRIQAFCVVSFLRT